MTLSNTPLRLLVKSHVNGLVDRQQYLQVRKQLLKKLSSQSDLNPDDLANFLKIHLETDSNETSNSYSKFDWLIIALGLMAASALGYILFS
jgi:hypothetical protein